MKQRLFATLLPAKTKQTLLIILAGLLIGGFGFLGEIQTKQSEYEHAHADLREHISLYRSYIEEELAHINIIADILSQTPLLQTALQNPTDPQTIKSSNIFLEKIRSKLHSSEIFLLTATGLTISASDSSNENFFIGKNFVFQPYFQNAMKKKNKPFIAFDHTTGQVNYFKSQALFKDQKILGVVVLKMNLKYLQRLSQGFKDTLLLSDEKNVVFLSSNKEFELTTLGPLSQKDRLHIIRSQQYPIHRLSPLTPALSTDLKNKPLSIITGEGTNQYLYEVQKLPHIGWSLWILTDLKTINTHALINGIGFGILTFITLIAFYLVYKRKQDLIHFQSIVNNLPSGVTFFDDDLQMLACNEKVKDVLDFPKDLFKQGLPNLHKLIEFNAKRGEYGAGDVQQLTQEALDKTNSREDHTFERTRPNGTVLEVRGTWLNQGGLVTTYTDITDRKKAEEEAQRNAGYLQSLLQNLDQGVTVTNENLDIIFWNKAFFRLLDLPDSLMKPIMHYEDLIRFNAERGEYGPGDPEQQVRARVNTSLKFEAHHFERKRPDGRTLEVTGKPLIIDGKKFGFITSYIDISEHKRMSHDLKILANSDDLTKLHNRRHFTHLLDIELKRSVRSGHPLSLLIMDLDHFKRVNEIHGHEGGDLALQKFAQKMKELLREIDVMGRLGGEEFAIFLPETNHKGAIILAERLRHCVENIDLTHNGKKLKFTVSIGLVLHDSFGEENLTSLMKRADTALYRAKNKGRNQVC